MLNLVKTVQEVQQEQAQQAQQAQNLEMTKAMPQLASAPMLDPTKNPQLLEEISGPGQTQPTPTSQEVQGDPTPE